jgi:hypothetical protein
MGHGFHGYVSHNQMQCFPVGRTCSQDLPIHTGGVSGGAFFEITIGFSGDPSGIEKKDMVIWMIKA